MTNRLITVMLLLLVTLIGSQSQQPPRSERVEPVGRFSSVHQDKEHCSGYSVDLWQTDNRIVGVFRACAGMVGDHSTALLQNAQLDPSTHALSFETKLSLGSDYLGGGKQVDSVDRYTFHGKLEQAHLSGALSHIDDASRNPITSTQNLFLKKQRDDLPRFSSMEAFKSRVERQIDKGHSKP